MMGPRDAECVGIGENSGYDDLNLKLNFVLHINTWDFGGRSVLIYKFIEFFRKATIG